MIFHFGDAAAAFSFQTNKITIAPPSPSSPQIHKFNKHIWGIPSSSPKNITQTNSCRFLFIRSIIFCKTYNNHHLRNIALHRARSEAPKEEVAFPANFLWSNFTWTPIILAGPGKHLDLLSSCFTNMIDTWIKSKLGQYQIRSILSSFHCRYIR